MDKLQQDLEEQIGLTRIGINVPLQEITHKGSGTVPLFITVTDAQELLKAWTIARSHMASCFVFELEDVELVIPASAQLVIKNNARKIDTIARKGKIFKGQPITDYAMVEAESGAPFSQVVRFTIEGGFGGIEDGLGIKGSVRSLFMHEKQYLDSLSRMGIIQALKVVSDQGESVDIPLSEYKDGLLVLSVIFKLQGEDTKILWLKARKAAEDRGVSDYK